MPRSYKHISYYENEILELRKQELSKREIREKLGFTIKQLINFITRYNYKQDKINVEIEIKDKYFIKFLLLGIANLSMLVTISNINSTCNFFTHQE